jgi:hypothetical protein
MSNSRDGTSDARGGSLTARGTTSNGHALWRARWPETLPLIHRSSGPCPRDPTTSRSTVCPRRVRSCAGSPNTTSPSAPAIAFSRDRSARIASAVCDVQTSAGRTVAADHRAALEAVILPGAGEQMVGMLSLRAGARACPHGAGAIHAGQDEPVRGRHQLLRQCDGITPAGETVDSDHNSRKHEGLAFRTDRHGMAARTTRHP